VTLELVRCEICRDPGERYCTDTVECNFRARRRLGIPKDVCFAWRARDVRERREVERRDQTRRAEEAMRNG
jgi:hypothetical protein